MSKLALVGWAIELLGAALWSYGYFVTGHPPIFDWKNNTPWWIADWLPNIESEIGMVLVVSALVPIYWPPER
jgi:hypothetical protein